jgi:hypothetical protein
VEGRCRWASFGDSSLFRSTQSRAVTRANNLVLRPDLTLPAEPGDSWCGRFALEEGERIAAVTDGVTNFVIDLERIHKVMRAPGDLEVARGLAHLAMESGAGDNIAVATCTA